MTAFAESSPHTRGDGSYKFGAKGLDLGK